jgi:integrase
MSDLRVRGGKAPWLFTSLDQRLTTNALKLSLKRAFEGVALEFKGIHAFRRASGIAYLRQGGQAEVLRVLMGWRSPEMISRYVRATETERATAAHKQFSPADDLQFSVEKPAPKHTATSSIGLIHRPAKVVPM